MHGSFETFPSEWQNVSIFWNVRIQPILISHPAYQPASVQWQNCDERVWFLHGLCVDRCPRIGYWWVAAVDYGLVISHTVETVVWMIPFITKLRFTCITLSYLHIKQLGHVPDIRLSWAWGNALNALVYHLMNRPTELSILVLDLKFILNLLLFLNTPRLDWLLHSSLYVYST
jgi:hypothetical protein